MSSNLDPAKNTGIFGGTFDPVHVGHVQIAKTICEKKLVDQVIFVPAGNPPHKLHFKITDKVHRLRMLLTALKTFDNFWVSDFEIHGERITYTFDTMKFFNKNFSGKLYLIMGMDSLHELETWNNAKSLVEKYNFIFYKRPGFPNPRKTRLIRLFGENNADRLLESVIDGKTNSISASEIRNLLRENKNASGFLSSEVLEYIKEEGLYRD